jgi:aspartate racemase
MFEKTIGVLGGMGPEATVELFRLIVRSTPAQKDQDHCRILIDNNPKIPDRTAAIVGQGPDPFPELLASARTLEAAGAGFIVMPCNTAHNWLAGLRRQVSIPIVDMVGETVSAASAHRPPMKSIGLLATKGTLEVGLYQKALKEKGLSVLSAEPNDQDVLMEIIYRVKAGDYTAKDNLLEVAQKILKKGADGLILGCTELPLILQPGDLACPLFDPLSVLAQTAVRLAEKDDG